MCCCFRTCGQRRRPDPECEMPGGIVACGIGHRSCHRFRQVRLWRSWRTGRAAEYAPANAMQGREAIWMRGSDLNVIIIDDQTSARTMLRHILEDIGPELTVHDFGDPAEAL